MPNLLKLYLSPYILLISLSFFLLGIVLVLIGFRQHNIKKRRDVIIRGSLMHGTYIFMSHGIGVIIYCVLYIMLLLNSETIQPILHILILLVSMLCSNVIYYASANYLWSRLAISRKNGYLMTRFFLVFVTPWYFLIV